MALSKQAVQAATEILKLLKQAQAFNSPVLACDIAGIIDRCWRSERSESQ